MDFQTLNRRELQALCKLNKIPANITSIAMVDALKSLKTVEGIEEFLNSSRTETVGLSIESPERIEITSPRVPRTSSRTSTRKKAKIDVNEEVLKTPLVSCTRKKDPETSFHDVANQLKECEIIAKNESLVNHEKDCIPNTPVETYSQMKVTKSTHKETVKKETTSTVQRAYSTRRSTRLGAKTSQGAGLTSKEDLGKPLQERHGVIVLDESDENSKIEKVVHVDTTFENEKEKVDCCEEMDTLKVKLVKVFEQLEEKSGQVDNLKSGVEGICNRSELEPSKLDNHNVAEVMNTEGIEKNISGNTVGSVNPKKQKASMSFEGKDGEAQESLSQIEGIEEFLNPSRTEPVEMSIESPERIEIASPRVLRTSSRTCTRKKAKIDVNEEVLKTPLVSCTRKKNLETSSFHDVSSQLKECEDIAKSDSIVNQEKNCMPNTPVETHSQMKVTKSTHKETVKKDITTSVQRAYSTRRSTRLGSKTSQGGGVTSQERHDVIVLDKSDEDSKIEKVVHVDTTVESGNEKVDNLKVKLVEVFEQLEEKSGHVDNLKSDLEGICNPIEPSKLDNHNAVEVMNAEGIEENISRNTVDSVNPKKQKASMSFEGEDGEPQKSLIEVEGIKEFLNPSRSETAELSIESPERIEVASPRAKKAKIVVDEEISKTPLVSCIRKKSLTMTPSSRHDVASQLTECEDEDIAKNESLVTKSTPQDTVSKDTTSEPLEIVNDLGNSILEKHDDVVLDENSEIEKVVNVVMNEVDNLKADSEVDSVNPNKEEEVSMDFEVPDAGEAQGSLMEEIGVETRHESSVAADVSLVEEEKNHQFSTNANDEDDDDVIVMTEVSENIIEENEKEVVVDMDMDMDMNVDEKAKAKAKSVFDKNSIRQLKKKLKATLLNKLSPPPTSVRIKTEDSDNKDINKPHAVVVEENEKEDVKSLNNNNNTCSLRQLKKKLKAASVKYNSIIA
ncbi:uncharacterized protein LOC111891840 [Lactuca sativa]|uniref:Uncharacterized protein n=1 Tax=Lactuca sativa TaxID=4236 RepID=A0A9R1WA53_LACSA|nr:uncharacterized protein LOC111891840 [Lactuca sativa]KAJ0218775.1 hypothetical protein LSAT_V11C300116560 [Lactuca sativa]